MADQNLIIQTADQLSAKFGVAQKEVISAMMKLVEGKTNAEAVAILNDLDVNAVMLAKTSGIITAYTSGNVATLN